MEIGDSGGDREGYGKQKDRTDLDEAPRLTGLSRPAQGGGDQASGSVLRRPVGAAERSGHRSQYRRRSGAGPLRTVASAFGRLREVLAMSFSGAPK